MMSNFFIVILTIIIIIILVTTTSSTVVFAHDDDPHTIIYDSCATSILSISIPENRPNLTIIVENLEDAPESGCFIYIDGTKPLNPDKTVKQILFRNFSSSRKNKQQQEQKGYFPFKYLYIENIMCSNYSLKCIVFEDGFSSFNAAAPFIQIKNIHQHLYYDFSSNNNNNDPASHFLPAALLNDDIMVIAIEQKITDFQHETYIQDVFQNITLIGLVQEVHFYANVVGFTNTVSSTSSINNEFMYLTFRNLNQHVHVETTSSFVGVNVLYFRKNVSSVRLLLKNIHQQSNVTTYSQSCSSILVHFSKSANSLLEFKLQDSSMDATASTVSSQSSIMFNALYVVGYVQEFDGNFDTIEDVRNSGISILNDDVGGNSKKGGGDLLKMLLIKNVSLKTYGVAENSLVSTCIFYFYSGTVRNMNSTSIEISNNHIQVMNATGRENAMASIFLSYESVQNLFQGFFMENNSITCHYLSSFRRQVLVSISYANGWKNIYFFSRNSLPKSSTIVSSSSASLLLRTNSIIIDKISCGSGVYIQLFVSIGQFKHIESVEFDNVSISSLDNNKSNEKEADGGVIDASQRGVSEVTCTLVNLWANNFDTHQTDPNFLDHFEFVENFTLKNSFVLFNNNFGIIANNLVVIRAIATSQNITHVKNFLLENLKIEADFVYAAGDVFLMPCRFEGPMVKIDSFVVNNISLFFPRVRAERIFAFTMKFWALFGTFKPSLINCSKILISNHYAFVRNLQTDGSLSNNNNNNINDTLVLIQQATKGNDFRASSNTAQIVTKTLKYGANIVCGPTFYRFHDCEYISISNVTVETDIDMSSADIYFFGIWVLHNIFSSNGTSELFIDNISFHDVLASVLYEKNPTKNIIVFKKSNFQRQFVLKQISVESARLTYVNSIRRIVMSNCFVNWVYAKAYANIFLSTINCYRDMHNVHEKLFFTNLSLSVKYAAATAGTMQIVIIVFQSPMKNIHRLEISNIFFRIIGNEKTTTTTTAKIGLEGFNNALIRVTTVMLGGCDGYTTSTFDYNKQSVVVIIDKEEEGLFVSNSTLRIDGEIIHHGDGVISISSMLNGLYYRNIKTISVTSLNIILPSYSKVISLKNTIFFGLFMCLLEIENISSSISITNSSVNLQGDAYGLTMSEFDALWLYNDIRNVSVFKVSDISIVSSKFTCKWSYAATMLIFIAGGVQDCDSFVVERSSIHMKNFTDETDVVESAIVAINKGIFSSIFNSSVLIIKNCSLKVVGKAPLFRAIILSESGTSALSDGTSSSNGTDDALESRRRRKKDLISYAEISSCVIDVDTSGDVESIYKLRRNNNNVSTSQNISRLFNLNEYPRTIVALADTSAVAKSIQVSSNSVNILGPKSIVCYNSTSERKRQIRHFQLEIYNRSKISLINQSSSSSSSNSNRRIIAIENNTFDVVFLDSNQEECKNNNNNNNNNSSSSQVALSFSILRIDEDVFATGNYEIRGNLLSSTNFYYSSLPKKNSAWYSAIVLGNFYSLGLSVSSNQKYSSPTFLLEHNNIIQKYNYYYQHQKPSKVLEVKIFTMLIQPNVTATSKLSQTTTTSPSPSISPVSVVLKCNYWNYSVDKKFIAEWHHHNTNSNNNNNNMSSYFLSLPLSVKRECPYPTKTISSTKSSSVTFKERNSKTPSSSISASDSFSSLSKTKIIVSSKSFSETVFSSSSSSTDSESSHSNSKSISKTKPTISISSSLNLFTTTTKTNSLTIPNAKKKKTKTATEKHTQSLSLPLPTPPLTKLFMEHPTGSSAQSAAISAVGAFAVANPAAIQLAGKTLSTLALVNCNADDNNAGSELVSSSSNDDVDKKKKKNNNNNAVITKLPLLDWYFHPLRFSIASSSSSSKNGEATTITVKDQVNEESLANHAGACLGNSLFLIIALIFFVVLAKLFYSSPLQRKNPKKNNKNKNKMNSKEQQEEENNNNNLLIEKNYFEDENDFSITLADFHVPSIISPLMLVLAFPTVNAAVTIFTFPSPGNISAVYAICAVIGLLCYVVVPISILVKIIFRCRSDSEKLVDTKILEELEKKAKKVCEKAFASASSEKSNNKNGNEKVSSSDDDGDDESNGEEKEEETENEESDTDNNSNGNNDDGEQENETTTTTTTKQQKRSRKKNIFSRFWNYSTGYSSTWLATPFVRRFDFMFDWFSVVWISLLDFLVFTILSILAGIVFSCKSSSCCSSLSIIALVICFLHFIIALIARPWLSRYDTIMGLLSMSITLLSCGVAVAVQFGIKEAEGFAVFLANIGIYVACFILLKDLIDIFLILKEQVSKKSDRNNNEKKAKMLEEIEYEMKMKLFIEQGIAKERKNLTNSNDETTKEKKKDQQQRSNLETLLLEQEDNNDNEFKIDVDQFSSTGRQRKPFGRETSSSRTRRRNQNIDNNNNNDDAEEEELTNIASTTSTTKPLSRNRSSFSRSQFELRSRRKLDLDDI